MAGANSVGFHKKKAVKVESIEEDGVAEPRLSETALANPAAAAASSHRILVLGEDLCQLDQRRVAEGSGVLGAALLCGLPGILCGLAVSELGLWKLAMRRHAEAFFALGYLAQDVAAV